MDKFLLITEDQLRSFETLAPVPIDNEYNTTEGSINVEPPAKSI